MIVKHHISFAANLGNFAFEERIMNCWGPKKRPLTKQSKQLGINNAYDQQSIRDLSTATETCCIISSISLR
jgi:hypothetical protein